MIRTQLSALPYIRNWRVGIVYFLIIPILNMFLLVAVTGTSTGKVDWQVATSSVLISGSLLALGSINALLVGDSDLGLSLEVAVQRPFSVAYWGSKIIVSALVAEIMILVNGILLWSVNLQVPLWQMLVISPISVTTGLILGITSFVASWGMDDPYFFLNIISTIGYLVSGTLVSLTKYPDWLRIISLIFPFGNTIEALRINKLDLALKDIPIMIVWLVIGLILYLYRISTITKKPNQKIFL